MNAVYTCNPLRDPRWASFAAAHPGSSIFHTVGWLDALRRTYGYEPVVYTTSRPAGQITNGIVACAVNSWLTGRRLVSVPFADHCEPLATPEELQDLLEAMQSAAIGARQRYIELRPKAALEPPAAWLGSSSYDFHELDLRPSVDELYRGLHRSTIQRKIERATREGLTHQEGNSDALLRAFYRLMLVTRRRHGLPPQPIQWFSNLIHCLGAAARIRVAYRGLRAVAAILTLEHRDTLIYKYGCSEAAFHNLGPMPMLFWTAIREARAAGLVRLDLGRSEWEHVGLRVFKRRWGATSSVLQYARCYSGSKSRDFVALPRIPTAVMGCVPEWMLTLAGKLLYRHMG